MSYVMQIERIERRLGPVVAGLARSTDPTAFEYALEAVDDAISRFDAELAGTPRTEPAAPQGALQKLYREAGI